MEIEVAKRNVNGTTAVTRCGFFVEERSADPLDRALAATQSDGPKDADEATPVTPVRRAEYLCGERSRPRLINAYFDRVAWRRTTKSTGKTSLTVGSAVVQPGNKSGGH
jgi:hypothetical protein